jgi:hypothetical protein
MSNSFALEAVAKLRFNSSINFSFSIIKNSSSFLASDEYSMIYRFFSFTHGLTNDELHSIVHQFLTLKSVTPIDDLVPEIYMRKFFGVLSRSFGDWRRPSYRYRPSRGLSTGGRHCSTCDCLYYELFFLLQHKQL